MNRVYILFFLLFCLFLPKRIFFNQPPEFGILFDSYLKREQERANSRSLGRGCSSCKFQLGTYKNEDGSSSNVYDVSSVPQLLSIISLKDQPIIIGLFSDLKSKDIFIKIAKIFDKKAAFIGINPRKAKNLYKLFLMVLRFEGTNIDEQNPIFLICDNNFMVLQNNSLNFKKGGIGLLSNLMPDYRLLMSKILEHVSEPSLNSNQNISKNTDSSNNNSYWDRFKKWLKSRLFSEK